MRMRIEPARHLWFGPLVLSGKLVVLLAGIVNIDLVQERRVKTAKKEEEKMG